MNNPAKWLSIDPGLAIAGFAILDSDAQLLDYGAIKTSDKLPHCQRLVAIASDFESLISTHNPDFFAIEQPFFGRQITSAAKVHNAVGVMLSVWGRLRECEPVMLHQSSWKAALVGGKANKKDVLHLIRNRFELPKILDDTADAIAIGLAAISGLRNNI